MGILISALTGSEDPSEVAVMAKQASEVIKTMKGPRQREASQPATHPNLRSPAEKEKK